MGSPVYPVHSCRCWVFLLKHTSNPVTCRGSPWPTKWSANSLAWNLRASVVIWLLSTFPVLFSTALCSNSTELLMCAAQVSPLHPAPLSLRGFLCLEQLPLCSPFIPDALFFLTFSLSLFSYPILCLKTKGNQFLKRRKKMCISFWVLLKRNGAQRLLLWSPSRI